MNKNEKIRRVEFWSKHELPPHDYLMDLRGRPCKLPCSDLWKGDASLPTKKNKQVENKYDVRIYDDLESFDEITLNTRLLYSE